jgi:Leucine-rich repeat (LRR) protein
MGFNARKRRWFQFSLRTLLALVVVAAIGLGFLAVPMHRARAQREAVEALLQAGADVEYDYQRQTDAAGSWVYCAEPPGPEWLRKILGNDFFADVVDVSFFHDERVSDHDLRHLCALSNLRELSIIEGKVTDAGLAHVTGLPNLREVRLSNLPITDESLVHLGRLTWLEKLELEGARITDAGLVHLHNLPNLRILELEGAAITDAGLEHLARLAKLQWLDVALTNITDEGLSPLKRLKNLKHLYIGATLITADGEKELQAALPGCHIVWWPRVDAE